MADTGVVEGWLPSPGPGSGVRPPGFRRADVVCLAGLFGGGALALALRFATPSLVKDHPILLEAVNGSALAIITGGAYARVGRDSLALVVLAPLAAILIYDGFAWWAGRLWGARIIDAYALSRSARARRRALRAEAWIRRRGVLALSVSYFLPIPNFLIYLLCGSSGMPLWVFLIGDAIGTLMWSGVMTGLGWSAGHSAISVVNVINHYALVITIALVVVAMLLARRRAAGLTGNVREEFSSAAVDPRDEPLLVSTNPVERDFLTRRVQELGS